MIERLLEYRWSDPAVARDAVERLAALGVPVGRLALPEAADAIDKLRWLEVSDDTLGRILDTRKDLERMPELVWLMDRCRISLVQSTGVPRNSISMPSLPGSLGPVASYFYVWVLLATLDATLEYHRRLGISPDESRETLKDLNRKLAEHEKTWGHPGFTSQNWMSKHLRGLIFECGRLQFERGTVGPNIASVDGCDQNEPILKVHIPEAGPLTDRACEDSFRQAASFFAKHFPNEQYLRYICDSWLLDPNLGDVLPPTSNIMMFQRRFTPLGISRIDDALVVQFVFRKAFPDGVVPKSRDALTATTTLERGIVDRLAAGEHWRFCIGWGDMPSADQHL